MIKDTKEKTIKETYQVYIAEDGTEFLSEEECFKYESSAAAMLLAKLNSIELARDYNTDWMCESDENNYRTVVPRCEDDINTLNHLWFMHGGKGKKAMFSAKNIGDVIMVGWRECDSKVDWVWFNNINTIIKDITNNYYGVKQL